MLRLTQVAFVAVLAAGAATADDWSKTYSVAGRPDLRVETDDGSVTIRPGDGRRIEAHVTTTVWKIAPGEVEIHESQSGDRVELTVKIPHRPFTFSGRGRSIHVDLRVPRQIHTDIRTGDGNIDMDGISGETRLRTGDGHIEALQLEGSVNAESGDGHVRVQGRLEGLTLHTGDGSVEAEVLPGSRMSSGWRVETGDGSVTLKLPDSFGADLELHTGDGSIALDMPALRSTGGKHEKDMHARLGSGGAVFSVRTGDGSIHVRSL
ncbi:MAG TPA: DUF4097 family beta strand repeat-containing protein [Bryobacteraceae bacterium]|nr:DUF4097 family beta strand repeat-containing protein [Bryobacteraceae bacterium]